MGIWQGHLPFWTATCCLPWHHVRSLDTNLFVQSVIAFWIYAEWQERFILNYGQLWSSESKNASIKFRLQARCGNFLTLAGILFSWMVYKAYPQPPPPSMHKSIGDGKLALQQYPSKEYAMYSQSISLSLKKTKVGRYLHNLAMSYKSLMYNVVS